MTANMRCPDRIQEEGQRYRCQLYGEHEWHSFESESPYVYLEWRTRPMTEAEKAMAVEQ